MIFIRIADNYQAGGFLIVAIVVIVAFVILVATPIIYRQPIFGCRCNIPPDLYQSVTRYYFGIGGETYRGIMPFTFPRT